jgi:hypothetical protein
LIGILDVVKEFRMLSTKELLLRKFEEHIPCNDGNREIGGKATGKSNLHQGRGCKR